MTALEMRDLKIDIVCYRELAAMDNDPPGLAETMDKVLAVFAAQETLIAKLRAQVSAASLPTPKQEGEL